MADAYDLVLVTNREVVEHLPASIRNDFREPEPGELWRIPVAIMRWGDEQPIAYR